MSTIPCTPVSETLDRDANGRFVKGNKGGPGNPFNRGLAANRSAMLNAGGPVEVENVTKMLYHRAMEGDVAAAKLFLEYVVGKPQKMKEPDLVDVDEFEVAKAKRVPHAHAVTAMIDMPVEEATEMAGSTPEPEMGLFFADPEGFMAEAAAEAGVVEDPAARLPDSREDGVPEEADQGSRETSSRAASEPREWTQKDEAYRIVGYFLANGEFPPGSPLSPLGDGASPEAVAEHKRMLAEFSRALKEGKWPGSPDASPTDSPFHPPLDGGAESTAKRETPVSAA